MRNILDDPGVLQVVLEEFEKHKLPRVLLIKECVDCGDPLNDAEMRFLKETYHEICSYESFVEIHPEFKKLYVDFVHLYCAILNLALENEQR